VESVDVITNPANISSTPNVSYQSRVRFGVNNAGFKFTIGTRLGWMDAKPDASLGENTW